MTLEELEANLKQMDSTIYEPTALQLRDWQKLEALMRVILSLVKVSSSLNSRLAEIESRLSTYMLGLEKLNEKHKTTPALVTYQGNGHQYPFSL